MFTYRTFQKANNKGADQTARMGRLVCACVVHKPLKTGFVTSQPINRLNFEGNAQASLHIGTVLSEPSMLIDTQNVEVDEWSNQNQDT